VVFRQAGSCNLNLGIFRCRQLLAKLDRSVFGAAPDWRGMSPGAWCRRTAFRWRMYQREKIRGHCRVYWGTKSGRANRDHSLRTLGPMVVVVVVAAAVGCSVVAEVAPGECYPLAYGLDFFAEKSTKFFPLRVSFVRQ
ncbi:unnamed protein product, partial [Ectocarpus fasciculatus]